MVVGDGALGFWAAVRKAFGGVKGQRCTVHKTADVLDKLPKNVQPKAKADLQEIFHAPTRQAAKKAFDVSLKKYQARYPKAAECLKESREGLLAFYDFLTEH